MDAIVRDCNISALRAISLEHVFCSRNIAAIGRAELRARDHDAVVRMARGDWR